MLFEPNFRRSIDVDAVLKAGKQSMPRAVRRGLIHQYVDYDAWGGGGGFSCAAHVAMHCANVGVCVGGCARAQMLCSFSICHFGLGRFVLVCFTSCSLSFAVALLHLSSTLFALRVRLLCCVLSHCLTCFMLVYEVFCSYVRFTSHFVPANCSVSWHPFVLVCCLFLVAPLRSVLFLSSFSRTLSLSLSFYLSPCLFCLLASA